MHRTYRLDVTQFIRPGSNTLDILFDVALVRGRELLEKFNHHTVEFNGSTERSRVFVRKAQYHYGWNWGASMVSITGSSRFHCQMFFLVTNVNRARAHNLWTMALNYARGVLR